MHKIKKNSFLFAGFLSIATIMMLASCANDTGNGNNPMEKPTSSDSLSTSGSTPGSTVKAGADSATNSATPTKAGAGAKKRKGIVSSAMISIDNTGKMEKDKEGVYSRAEKMPEYPGGEKALSKFVENNINYPQDAIDQDTEGTVNVSFVVDEKGKVLNPYVTGKPAGHGLDEEAVKVVKQMPAWKPGMVKGKPVKTRLALPVTFRLSEI